MLQMRTDAGSIDHVQRIGTILHLDVTNEAILAREYLKVQRWRRQQWLRELLSLAFAADMEVAGHHKEANPGALERLRHQTLRIQIYLDIRMEREAAILETYLSLPRARRGRWVLDALLMGHQIKNGVANAKLPEMGNLILRPRPPRPCHVEFEQGEFLDSGRASPDCPEPSPDAGLDPQSLDQAGSSATPRTLSDHDKPMPASALRGLMKLASTTEQGADA